MKPIVFCVLAMLGLMSASAFADSAPVQVLQGVQTQVGAATSLDTGSFVNDVITVIEGVKGSVPVGLKIAGLVLLIIASMKVSFLQPFWKAIGSAQAFVAPALGLILGLLLFGAGTPVTAASLFAYLLSGGGAIMLHELLDATKGIPGIGTVYVSIINAIEGLLGGSSSSS